MKKIVLKKKKKCCSNPHLMGLMSGVMAVGALVGIAITWVTLISWEQLNRQAVAEYTARVVQQELMKR
jgi:hypothetical protein